MQPNTDSSSVPTSEKLDFSPDDESLHTNMSSLSLGPPPRPQPPVTRHARSGSATTLQLNGLRPPTAPRAMRTRSFGGLSVNTLTPPVASGPSSGSYPPSSHKSPRYNNPRQYSPFTPPSYSPYYHQQQPLINGDSSNCCRG